MKKNFINLISSILMLFPFSPLAHAQDFPERALRLLVGFSPGGTTDLLARLTAQELSSILNESVVVENRPGASGTIAASVVAKSPGDGHTMLQVANTQATVRSLYASLPYQDEDLAPIALTMISQYVLVTHPSLPVRTLESFIDYLKKNPGTHYASSGVGSPQHLAGEMFGQMAGVDISHVAYKGSSELLPDLLAGRVPFAFDNLAVIQPYINKGAVNAIAVTGQNRSKALPSIPTMIEAGVPGFEVSGWFGLAVAAGTPDPVIDVLNTAVNEFLRKPEIIERMHQLGAEPGGGTPEDFGALQEREKEKWGKIIRQAGIQIEK